MWIIEWSYASDYEYGVTAWASENEALKQACNEIMNHILGLNPEPDSELIDESLIINNFILAAEYRKAIDHWNNCDYNTDCDPMLWLVREITPQHYYGGVTTLWFNSNKKEVIDSSVVIDDHTCTLCGNTKCSKQEKSCWKCGNLI